MTTTHPVDSTYHRCCNSIGQHGRDCADGLPAGAIEAGPWKSSPGGGRWRLCICDVYEAVGDWCLAYVSAFQFDGETKTVMYGVDVRLGVGGCLPHEQADALAAAIVKAAARARELEAAQR